MKHSHFFIFLLIFTFFVSNSEAQKNARPPQKISKAAVAQSAREPTSPGIVIDERLAVLRSEPSLFAKTVQRMRSGRAVSVFGSKQADGVTFYRVKALPNSTGWVQAEAITGRFRRGDDSRLARLVQSSEGFEQIERAQIFLDTFANSPLRPAILLLLGDLMEETALKISTDALKKLDRREMAASGAPLHSFYLNYTSLDRYRKIGINFVFNPNTKLLHYDGESWREIVSKFPNTSEAVEAQKRLDSLKAKMEAKESKR